MHAVWGHHCRLQSKSIVSQVPARRPLGPSLACLLQTLSLFNWELGVLPKVTNAQLQYMQIETVDGHMLACTACNCSLVRPPAAAAA